MAMTWSASGPPNKLGVQFLCKKDEVKVCSRLIEGEKG
jgi:hypothetical protein